MDCVSCERCRLWGKIQTVGIGTALKIMAISFDPRRWDSFRLRRSELIALFNAFGRFSDSIESIGQFERLRESTIHSVSTLVWPISRSYYFVDFVLWYHKGPNWESIGYSHNFSNCYYRFHLYFKSAKEPPAPASMIIYPTVVKLDIVIKSRLINQGKSGWAFGL